MFEWQFAKLAHRFQSNFRVGCVTTETGGNGLLLERPDADHRLDRTARGQRVAEEPFHRRKRRHRFAEQAPQRFCFHRVVVGRAGAVRAHIIDAAGRQTASFQRQTHGCERAVAFGMRRGGVAGVATRAPARQPGQNLRAARPRRGFRFQHEHSGTFAETDAGACGIEGPAAIGVQQEQRAKTIQGQPRQRICAARNHDVGLAALNHFRRRRNGHRARRTRRGKSEARSAHSEPARAQFGGRGTFVKTKRAEALLVFAEQPAQDLFRAQHASDGGAEGHADTFGRHGTETGFQPRLLYRFLCRNPRELVRTRAAHVASQGVHVHAHLADLMPVMTR